jgi:hypothetical protein
MVLLSLYICILFVLSCCSFTPALLDMAGTCSTPNTQQFSDPGFSFSAVCDAKSAIHASTIRCVYESLKSYLKVLINYNRKLDN